MPELVLRSIVFLFLLFKMTRPIVQNDQTPSLKLKASFYKKNLAKNAKKLKKSISLCFSLPLCTMTVKCHVLDSKKGTRV